MYRLCAHLRFDSIYIRGSCKSVFETWILDMKIQLSDAVQLALIVVWNSLSNAHGKNGRLG